MNYWFIFGIMNAIELTLVVIITALVFKEFGKLDK